MPDAQLVAHQVQVHTTGFRWRGTLSLPATRRVSDFVNESGTHFLLMQDLTLAAWEKGVARDLTTMSSAAVSKQNMLALFIAVAAPNTRNAEYERVAKIPQRVMIYTNFFTIMGNLHLIRDANWLDAISVLRQDFLSLTDVSAWCLNSGSLVASGVNLALVNRLSITALHPVAQPQAASVRPPVFQNHSWTRMRELRIAEPEKENGNTP